jgi:hypothetical protein
VTFVSVINKYLFGVFRIIRAVLARSQIISFQFLPEIWYNPDGRGLLIPVRDLIMKAKLQKIAFIALALVLLFLLYRWAISLKKSGSPYIQFPNKIETFK